MNGRTVSRLGARAPALSLCVCLSACGCIYICEFLRWIVKYQQPCLCKTSPWFVGSSSRMGQKRMGGWVDCTRHSCEREGKKKISTRGVGDRMFHGRTKMNTTTDRVGTFFFTIKLK